MNFFLVIISLFYLSQSVAQNSRTVRFPSEDGLTITADIYEINPKYTWIALFHQANSSRGEFRNIAPRLNKLELNCIAFDLRSGKESNYITNETYVLAKKKIWKQTI